ncbi:MAG: L-threonine 3-dehydrogenase [Verrucomicrobia bacterium]|nr:L-threonine 3-dehydrogenase [Verrucomicrobiota bacterium]
MKALGKLKKEKGLWLYDAPMPEIGPDEVLIKIKYTALCGTDLHIYLWDAWAQKTIPVPMTVGHEFMGIIEKVGRDVKGLKVGDRVSGEGHIVCGRCRNCREERRHLCPSTQGIGVNRTGCFAEYLAHPAINVIPLPKEIPDEVASFLDPLGNAVHTALSFDLVGQDVLITGSGPIGMMAAAIAKFVGARRVVVSNTNDFRLNMAKKMGATEIVNVTKTTIETVEKQLNIDEGFTVGLEMSGNPEALRSMITNMSHGGNIALLGILPAEASINWVDVIFKGLTLKGIYGRKMFETWNKMISMILSGLDVRPIITHVLPYQEFDKGFEAMQQGNSGKVVLKW